MTRSIDDCSPAEWDRAAQKFKYQEKDTYIDPYDKQPDLVNNPSHYNNGNIECIEYLHDNLGREGFISYCDGNIKKYLHRWRYKGNELQDLQKAHWYLKRLIETVEQK